MQRELLYNEDVESRVLVASEPLPLRPARSDPGAFSVLLVKTRYNYIRKLRVVVQLLKQ